MSVRRIALRRSTAAAAVLGLALLAGCGNDSTPSAPAATGEPTTAAATDTAATASLTVADAWAKAVPDISQNKMTGIFASITNPGTETVTVTEASTSASNMTELHETVMKDGESVMQKVENGFEIAPGTTRELKPGGDHIMVMMMSKPLAVGDAVTVTLTTSTGEKIEFDAVAKEFTGADERYADGEGHGEMSGSPSSAPATAG